MPPLVKIEILLPLFYNDGTEIKDQLFADTYDNILKRFKDGLTKTNIPLIGDWIDPDTGIQYNNERNTALWILCKKTRHNLDSLRELKKTLKRLFKQNEILMYYVYVYRL